MIKLVKDNKVITATEKAFEVIYKGLGYEKYNIESNEGVEKSFINDVEKSKDELDKPTKRETFNKYTVEQLKEVAKARGIKGHSNMKKDELINILAGD